MADILNEEYTSVIRKFVVIDCRYPYEFVGGHVRVGLRHPVDDQFHAVLDDKL